MAEHNQLEVLSAELHAIYQAEARRQAEAGDDTVRHPDNYDELPEHTKEYDRVLARFILQREQKPRDIHQRLQEVVALVKDIKGTSTNQFRDSAIGIKDVEVEIKPLLVNAGILSPWSWIAVDQIPMVEGSRERLWRVHLRVWLINCDDPRDFVTGDAIDVGSNPAAGASFARKGFYKAIFHIASAEDEGSSASTQQRRTAQRSPQQIVESKVANREDTGEKCDMCEQGKLIKVTMKSGGTFVGCSNSVRSGGTCARKPAHVSSKEPDE